MINYDQISNGEVVKDLIAFKNKIDEMSKILQEMVRDEYPQKDIMKYRQEIAVQFTERAWFIETYGVN
jgi:hypothetical protein